MPKVISAANAESIRVSKENVAIYEKPGKGAILCMEAEEASRHFSDGSVDLIVTSVPYFQQRKYTDDEREIGIEATVAEYVEGLVSVFGKYARVLKDHGTIYVNIGDKRLHGALLAVPEKFTMAMVHDGWEFVQEIIWHKSDAIPEGAASTLRPSRDHERILMFAKSSHLAYYDHFAVRSETACLRTVWKIASSGRSKHHAPYPEELAMTAILASSPEHVCEKCGMYYARIVESVRRPTRPGLDNKVDPTGKSNRDRLRHVTDYVSKGFRQVCKCKNPVQSKAVVLDMFCGSGTTPACAVMAGRFGYGVDLSYAFAHDSAERLDRSFAGMTEAKKSPLAKFVNARQLSFQFQEVAADEEGKAERKGKGKAEACSTSKVPGRSKGNAMPFLPIFRH